MALQLKTVSGYRELSAAEVKSILRGHPPPVVVAMMEHLAAIDHVVTAEHAGRYLADQLMKICAVVWKAATEAVPPGPPGYRFVAPPAGAATASPRRIGSLGVVTCFSSYAACEPAQLETIAILGSKALARLEAGDFTASVPEPGSPERAEVIGKLARDLGAVLHAARHAQLVRTGPTSMLVEVPPGGVPAEVERCIAHFVRGLRRADLVALDILASWTEAFGVQPPPPADTTLDDLGPVYEKLDDMLRASGSTVTWHGDALLNGTGTDWTIEGTRIREHQPLAPLWDGARVREHLVVPPLRPPPSEVYGEELGSPSMPLVFVLSDLHLGQGPEDGAEEIDAALESAFVQALDAWAARVQAYRATHPSSPAYLVLNGDILDFWSADIIPGSPPRSDLVARRIGGVARGQLTREAAAARMERILAAHPAFFDGVRGWVAESRLNFLIYVGGNHDDHLVRYGLGGALVQRLGGPRGAFAAKSAYFPQLRTLIEHGHRSDDHNRFDPRFDHGIGCLGELIVALLINPIERAGLAPCLSLRDDHDQPVDVPDAHGLRAAVDALEREYDKMRRAAQLAPVVYPRVLREIDNLENSGAEDILIDYAARLAGATSEAAAEAMESVGDAILEIQGVWARDEFQSLLVRLGSRLAPIFPPDATAAVVDAKFAANHPEDLGFDPGSGLRGHRSMRVHVVGHTHRPRLTTPVLESRLVPAQHVNTGTGQNMWIMEDTTLGIDVLSKLGITAPVDHVRPVDADQYCLIYLSTGDVPGAPRRLRIHVEGGSYRMTQSYSMMNSGQAVQGRLAPRGTNMLDL